MFFHNNKWQKNSELSQKFNNLLELHLSPLFYDSIPDLEDKKKKIIYLVDFSDSLNFKMYFCDSINNKKRFKIVNTEIINCIKIFDFKNTEKYLLPFSFYESLIKSRGKEMQ